MAALVDGVIAEGDVVAVKGDRAFFDALAAALGDRAAAIVNADLDTRPHVHVGGDGQGGLAISFPWERGRPAEPVRENLAPDPRVFIVYVSETARNGAHLCEMVPVILQGLSPTFARVLKAEGAALSGVALQLIDGKPQRTQLPQLA